MGKQLGFPTINLVYPENSNFETGVYLCTAAFADSVFNGVMHLGPRPTMDDAVTFEIYLLDFDGRETYGAQVYVEVLKKLRKVKKFPNTDALVKQIKEDVKEARDFFKEYRLDEDE